MGETRAVNKEILEGIEDLLREWLSLNDEDCIFDHHGYCQTHFLQSKEHCIVNRTKKILGIV